MPKKIDLFNQCAPGDFSYRHILKEFWESFWDNYIRIRWKKLQGVNEQSKILTGFFGSTLHLWLP